MIMQKLAADEGVSMSMLARDLIKESLERREDAALAAFAEKRGKSFEPGSALTHEQVWE